MDNSGQRMLGLVAIIMAMLAMALCLGLTILWLVKPAVMP